MLKGPIALGTVRTSFVLGLRLFIQAGTLLLVARMLGPQEFGAFAGISSVAVLFGALSTFGTNLVLLGEMSSDTAKRNYVLSYAIPTTFLCGALLIAVYMVIASWLLLGNSLPWPVLLAIGVAEVLLQPLFSLMSTEHHACGRIARAQLMLNIPLILRLLIASIIFFLDLTSAIDIYAGGYLVASALALILGAHYLPEKWPNWKYWHLPNLEKWRRSFGYAAINISRAAPAEIDKALAVKLLPIDSAGVYVAGTRVVWAITLPIAALVLSALPRLFREVNRLSTKAKNLLLWMYGATFVCSLILTAILWFMAPLVEMIFGDLYQRISEIIRWLCLAVPGISMRMVSGSILVTCGSITYRVLYEFSGMLLLLLLSVALAPEFGVLGIIFAVIVSEWSMAMIGCWKILYRPYFKGGTDV